MRARMLGARGRVVQKGIGEAHVFLLTRASWAEPNGSVYCHGALYPLQSSCTKLHFCASAPYLRKIAVPLQEQSSRLGLS